MSIIVDPMDILTALAVIVIIITFLLGRALWLLFTPIVQAYKEEPEDDYALALAEAYVKAYPAPKLSLIEKIKYNVFHRPMSDEVRFRDYKLRLTQAKWMN